MSHVTHECESHVTYGCVCTRTHTCAHVHTRVHTYTHVCTRTHTWGSRHGCVYRCLSRHQQSSCVCHTHTLSFTPKSHHTHTLALSYAPIHTYPCAHTNMRVCQQRSHRKHTLSLTQHPPHTPSALSHRHSFTPNGYQTPTRSFILPREASTSTGTAL